MTWNVSNCCGASPVGGYIDHDCDDMGVTTEELGICSKCSEHCEYIPEDDFLYDWEKQFDPDTLQSKYRDWNVF
jgi:hypothetical protein